MQRYLSALVVMVAVSGCAGSAVPTTTAQAGGSAAGAAAADPAPGPAAPSGPRSAAAMAEHILELVGSERIPELYALFSAGMQAKISEQDLGALIESLHQAQGAWTSVETGSASGDRGWFVVHAERGDWRLDLVVDEDGNIASLLVRDHKPAPPVATSEIDLALPVRGQWLVFWGGPTAELNHHVDHASQRRAVDLVVVDPNGKTFRGDGTSNSDYLAYGKEVVAVAPGVVATVVDGVPDNTPGKLNPYMTTGNLVIIDHGNSVFSAYAHLIPGSIPVRVGDKVERGQRIGKCGNSGNSSEAHLHFQLQDGVSFSDSWGIDAMYRNLEVVRDGKRRVMTEYTFRKGDQVIGR